MRQFLKTISKTGLLAVCLLTGAGGFSAEAEERRHPQTTLMPSAGAQLHAQIKNEQLRLFQYPNCPMQFQIVQKTPIVFTCRRTVSNGIDVQLYTAVAESMSCAPTSYWDNGPIVHVQAYGGAKTRISVTCRHTN